MDVTEGLDLPYGFLLPYLKLKGMFQHNHRIHPVQAVQAKVFLEKGIRNHLFNIQFKEGEQGVRLLEINPRPSGGFGMACLSGANLAQIALQSIKGEIFQPPTIRYGLRVTEINTPVVL